MAGELTPRQILDSYRQRIIDALVESLDKNGKVAGGGLRQSIDVRFDAFATSFVVNIDLLSYYKWVDEGRKPGGKMPPMDAMLKHVANRGEWYTGFKPIPKSTKKNKIPKEKKKSLKETRNRQLAFLIGRSIAKKGIKPTNFIQEALDGGVLDSLVKDMSIALSRELTIIFKTPE